MKAARLLQRLPGCYGGCQAIVKVARILRRLPGYCKGYQATKKAARLLQRLPCCCKGCQVIVKDATELVGCCGGWHIATSGVRIIHGDYVIEVLRHGRRYLMVKEAVVEVMAEIMGGSYEDNAYLLGLKRSWLLTDSSLTNSILPAFIGKDALTYMLQTHRRTSKMERAFEEKSVSTKTRGLRKEGGLRREGVLL
ncbi:hypothetical protein Tco_1428630 [Tanacetum coccineum]